MAKVKSSKRRNRKELKELKKGEEYVPSKSTKYDKLEKKYFQLYKVLKNEQKKWEWASAKIGKDNITPRDLYELCRTNVVAYVVFMKDRVPYPHQIKMFEVIENNKYSAIGLSRRLGKSFGLKWYADYSCRFNRHPVESDGTKWSIMMQNKDTGKEVYMEKAYLELRDGDRAVAKNFQGELGDDFFSGHLVNREEKYGQVTGYKFTYNTLTDMSYNQFVGYNKADKKGKKAYRVVPSTFKVITSSRGIEGNVICDEIGFWHKNPHLKNSRKVFNEEVRPIVTIEGHLKCVVCSTANGMDDNIFTDLFNPTDEKVSVFKRLWYPCWVHRTKPDYIKSMIDMREEYAQNGELATFQQEYECKFVRGKDGFFDEELHINRFFDDKLTFTTMSNMDCVISVDWGGTNTSHSVTTVQGIDSETNDIVVLYYKEYDVNEDSSIIDDIRKLTLNFPNYRKIVCDNKGGRFAVSRLQELLGEHKVETFNFTTQKRDGYFALKTAIVNHNIKCPYDKRIREQMRNFTDKLKPNSADISDDVLDTIMMPVYSMEFDKNNVYEVIQYKEDDWTPTIKTDSMAQYITKRPMR